MAQVTIDKFLAEDLVDTKISIINSDINQLLETWNYNSHDKFLEDARNGTLEEAEMDAMAIRQLLITKEKLFKLKGSWNRE